MADCDRLTRMDALMPGAAMDGRLRPADAHGRANVDATHGGVIGVGLLTCGPSQTQAKAAVLEVGRVAVPAIDLQVVGGAVPATAPYDAGGA